jgi:hypothetical protein
MVAIVIYRVNDEGRFFIAVMDGDSFEECDQDYSYHVMRDGKVRGIFPKANVMFAYIVERDRNAEEKERIVRGLTNAFNDLGIKGFIYNG